MSAVSEALERYFTTIESFGATVHHRLLPSATEAELTWLEEFIGVDLPREVRDLYAFTNGTDLNHPGTNSTSGRLFPVLAPASVSEAIRLASWYRDYTDQIDPSYTYATRTGIPLLHPLGGDEAMLLADCSSPSTRFVTRSGGEGYRDDAGYYYQSLVDFIDGARRHAEAGRFESISGGVHISDDAYTEDVLLNYRDPRGALRLIYGFDLMISRCPGSSTHRAQRMHEKCTGFAGTTPEGREKADAAESLPSSGDAGRPGPNGPNDRDET